MIYIDTSSTIDLDLTLDIRGTHLGLGTWSQACQWMHFFFNLSAQNQIELCNVIKM